MTKSPRVSLHGARRLRGAPPAAVRALLLRLLAWAEPPDSGRLWSALDIHVTDNEGIRPYKLASFGRDEVTDVITMTYAPAPGLPGWSGELIVNAERARELGGRFGGAHRELALYLAHGIDHLTGGTDDTPAERRRMRARERRWLARADAEGLLAPLAGFGADTP